LLAVVSLAALAAVIVALVTLLAFGPSHRMSDFQDEPAVLQHDLLYLTYIDSLYQSERYG
jgi:hypothetical protein